MLSSSTSLPLLLVASFVVDGAAFVAPPTPATFPASIVSRRLLASSTATSSLRDKSARDGGEILEPQGDHHSWYSLQPLLEAAKWAGTPGTYFKEMREKHGGAPIFKAHPALKCTMLTDHASGKWFFSQPETVLDRQDGAYFGPMKCNKEYIGDSLPALLSNLKESHPDIRDYMIAAFRERLGNIEVALAHATNNFYDNLRENGVGEYPGVHDTFLQQSSAFMLEWTFGTGEEGGQPLPPFKDFLAVNPSDVSVLLGLTADTPVANLAAKAAQAAAGGASTSAEASVDVLLDSIRASKAWPTFSKMLEESGVQLDNLENSFMFNTGFQSSSAIAKSMEFCLGSLTMNPDFLEELRKEVDGKELTIKSVGDTDKFPLLDSFHWEILRLFPAVPFYFKSAQMDVVVPTSSGQDYQIRKGDMLCCHQPLVHIDEAVFGPDATEFKPKRFVGNADLKKEVFAFGFSKPLEVEPVEGMPWGCIAHSLGVLDGILKVFYGRWVQEAIWELDAPPVIDPVEYLGVVGPAGPSFAKVTPRE